MRGGRGEGEARINGKREGEEEGKGRGRQRKGKTSKFHSCQSQKSFFQKEVQMKG